VIGVARGPLLSIAGAAALGGTAHGFYAERSDVGFPILWRSTKINLGLTALSGWASVAAVMSAHRGRCRRNPCEQAGATPTCSKQRDIGDNFRALALLAAGRRAIGVDDQGRSHAQPLVPKLSSSKSATSLYVVHYYSRFYRQHSTLPIIRQS
jgi:hypothetical protein